MTGKTIWETLLFTQDRGKQPEHCHQSCSQFAVHSLYLLECCCCCTRNAINFHLPIYCIVTIVAIVTVIFSFCIGTRDHTKSSKTNGFAGEMYGTFDAGLVAASQQKMNFEWLLTRLKGCNSVGRYQYRWNNVHWYWSSSNLILISASVWSIQRWLVMMRVCFIFHQLNDSTCHLLVASLALTSSKVPAARYITNKPNQSCSAHCQLITCQLPRHTTLLSSSTRCRRM